MSAPDALADLRMLIEYAYANGFHELGYDPLAVLAMATAPEHKELIAEIDAFMADAPKGKPHTGYRYGELLAACRTALESAPKETK